MAEGLPELAVKKLGPGARVFETKDGEWVAVSVRRSGRTRITGKDRATLEWVLSQLEDAKTS